MLETLLTKQRILEIYSTTWNGAKGCSGRSCGAPHFHTAAATLGPSQAARLAVMLPAPNDSRKRPDSPYVFGRAGTVMARMGSVELP